VSAPSPNGDAETESRAFELVGRLTAGAVHDLNNVLHAVLGYASALAALDGLPDEARAHAADIRLAGERGAELTAYLLALARGGSATPERVDVNAAVRDTVRMLRRMLGDRIDVELALAPGALAVRAPRGAVQRTLMNLLLNARDAMPDGGRIGVETRLSGPGLSSVVLTVTDEGHGMSDEVVARAGRPLFTTKRSGTGLGLASSRAAIEECGGALTLASTRGRGSRVEIALPAA
jgi:signal transduction histidine kinase